ncbi:MAG: TonB-dependent receptor [Bacteroidota bacterium]
MSRIYFYMLTFWLFSSLFSLHAQSTSIQGQVFGTDNQPLEFATVAIDELGQGTFTDLNGLFQLEIEATELERLTLSIQMLGFTTVRRSFNPQQPPQNLRFQLQESSLALNQVVVTGTLKTVDKLDSPVPVEVYSDAFFKANPTPSIFESLQNVNGVRPQLNCNVCNTGDIHINGLEGPYTMVLLDGMPIVSGLSTVYGLTGIPQSLIDRIEVVKGPAATLYGSEAVGGLINIITKNPTSAPRLSADVFSSSWGEINTDLGLRFGVGENASSLLGINYFNFQQRIDNNDDGFTDLTLQDRLSVFNKWHFRRSSGRAMSLAARYVYEDRWGGDLNWQRRFRGGDEVYGESIYTNRWELLGTYEFDLPTSLTYQFSANGHYQNSVYGDLIYNAKQYVGFQQLLWNPKLTAGHDLLIGAAMRYTFYDDDTPATASSGDLRINAASEIYLPGVFIQDEITFDRSHRLLLGLRYDYNSVHGGIWSPRLNYQWTSPSRLSSLRISAGNGYRVANVFTEDHAALTGARQLVFEDELAPERSWNLNLNWVQQFFTNNNTFIGLDASVFYTRFQNQIIPDYDTDPNKIIYANLDGFSVSRGISLNVDLRLPTGLSLNAGATLMDVFFEENGERNTPVLTESFNGVWSLNYRTPASGWTFDYTGNLYGPMRLPLLGDLDPRAEFSPWFSTQNVQLTKRFNDRWEVYGGIKNLLDFTPAANSIARPEDPFDQGVEFDAEGQVIPTAENPFALSFDPSYVYASNQGRRAFFGIRMTIR